MLGIVMGFGLGRHYLQTRPKIYGITYDFKTAHGEQQAK